MDWKKKRKVRREFRWMGRVEGRIGRVEEGIMDG